MACSQGAPMTCTISKKKRIKAKEETKCSTPKLSRVGSGRKIRQNSKQEDSIDENLERKTWFTATYY
nr:11280_t:CDS:2 [Entrophospora candida]